jgi:hypothetical protein
MNDVPGATVQENEDPEGASHIATAARRSSYHTPAAEKTLVQPPEAIRARRMGTYQHQGRDFRSAHQHHRPRDKISPT